MANHGPTSIDTGRRLHLDSRLALVSTDGRALAVWSDTRAGTDASGKQDLARAVVAFEPASPLRAPLRSIGPTLAGLGLVGGLWSLRRPSGPLVVV